MTIKPRGWLAGMILLSSGPLAAQPPAALVQVDEVRLEQAQRQVLAVGQVIPDQAGDIAARTAGTVTEAPLPVGTSVSAGDTLLALDGLAQSANLADAKINLKHAAAELELARLQYQRAKRLSGSQAMDQATIDQRKLEVEAAEAEHNLARVNLARAETDMDWVTVKAPFDGVVTALQTNLGAWVNRGDAVMQMVGTGRLWIEVAVPAHAAQGVLPESLPWENDQGLRGEAKIYAMLPAENPRARTRTLRLQPADQQGLLPYAPVEVRLRTASEAQSLTVHKDAIVRKLSGAVVFVAQDGKADERSVELGAAVGSRLIVLSGLKAGERVVVRGNERLRSGQPVRYHGAG